jgi:hypothetical protein
MHIFETSSGWRKYRIEGNRSRWFGHGKRMDEYRIPRTLLEKKITGNEDDWKKSQGHTINKVARSSQERHRKNRMFLVMTEEMQVWTDRGCWRLLCKSQPTRVETT